MPTPFVIVGGGGSTGPVTSFTAPLTSEDGWTLRDGSGTAEVTGGVVRLTLGSGVAPGSYANVPFAGIAHGIVGRHPLHSLDAVARIKTFSGGNSNQVYAGFGLRQGTAATDGLVVQVRGDGLNTFGYSENISNSGTIGFNTGIGRSTIAGGRFYQRLTINDGTIRTMYGVGIAGAEPTTWTVLGTETTMTAVTVDVLSKLAFTLDGGSGSPTDVTVEWDKVKISIVGLR